MLKKLLMTAACALAVGSATAGPIAGESDANPFWMTVGSHVDVKWDPPGPGLWVWAQMEKLLELHVKVASDTTFDFGLAPPNNGSPQDFEFKLRINGVLQTDVGAPGMVSYYDNITLLAGTSYLFTLEAYNKAANAANTDIDLLARNANGTPTDPGGPGGPGGGANDVPEPASLGLLGLGLMGLAVARRRKE